MEYVHHNRTEDDDGEARRFFTRRRSRSVSSTEEVTKVDDNLFPPRKRRPPTGHELDRINDHISLEHFGKQLQKAANAIFPDDGERASKYTRVDVILLSWKDEDPKLPVSVEAAALARTFEDVYGHNVEHWLIPSEESHIKLQGKILQFLGDNDPAHLKIVYYAGHGRLTNHGQPAWTSLQNRRKERCPTIKWSGIQNTLEESRSDVLILLDCCASGVCTSDEGNGVTELIAACTYNSVANGVGQYSFSHVLNDKLKQLSQLPCYNIGHLYNAMYSEVQGWRVEDYRLLKVPIHLVLSQNHDLPRSIRLSKARPAGHLRSANAQESQLSSSSPANAASRTELSDTSEDSKPSLLSSPNTSLSQLAEYPRLLFSIRLSQDVKPYDLSSELFADWLRCVPVSAKLVRVEAGFASDSTITLVSVPAALLAYLAPDPAILLLGSIRSKNFVSEYQRAQDAVSSDTPVLTHSTAPMKTMIAQPQSITTGIPRVKTEFQRLNFSPYESLGEYSGSINDFSEVEKRFLLAEMAKKSTIPPKRMIEVFQMENMKPDWEHMLLPNGRNLSECKSAFDSFFWQPSNQLPTLQLQPQLQPQSFLVQPPFLGASHKRKSTNTISGPDSKRRKSGTEAPTTHNILPKPSNSSGSPLTMTTLSLATSNQKKRGRPSKADIERKQREAIERGDIIPPALAAASPAGLQGQEEVKPRGFPPIASALASVPAPVPSRNPQAAMTQGHILSPQMGMEQVPPVIMSADTGKKRRARPPPKPKVPKPGESQFSIHPPVDQSWQGEEPFRLVPLLQPPGSSFDARPITLTGGSEQYALSLTDPPLIQESSSGLEQSAGPGRESLHAEEPEGEGSVARRTRSRRSGPSS